MFHDYLIIFISYKQIYTKNACFSKFNSFVTDFDNKRALQIIVFNVFKVAEFKSAIKFLKFIMVDLI